MISAPCWNCLFPMVAMGMKVSMGGTDDDIEMPEARSKNICVPAKAVMVCRTLALYTHYGCHQK